MSEDIIEQTEQKEKKWFFSIFSGEIYQIDEEDIKNLDTFQIPLIKKPDNKCKKCYGRMHIGYNLTHKNYDVCNKCLRKYIDLKSPVLQSKKASSKLNIQ